jgi:DNA-binding MarR family transcriptional regulator
MKWLESEPSISDRRENAVRTTKKGKELAPPEIEEDQKPTARLWPQLLRL